MLNPNSQPISQPYTCPVRQCATSYARPHAPYLWDGHTDGNGFCSLVPRETGTAKTASSQPARASPPGQPSRSG